MREIVSGDVATRALLCRDRSKTKKKKKEINLQQPLNSQVNPEI